MARGLPDMRAQSLATSLLVWAVVQIQFHAAASLKLSEAGPVNQSFAIPQCMQHQAFRPNMNITTARLPSVTIVVATYSKKHVLHQYIDQIFKSQKYPREKLDMLIFDDGDTPSPMASRWNATPQIRYHYNTSHHLVGDKRNWLLDNAKGDLIITFDDDDFYGENYVRYMVEDFINNPKLRMSKLNQWLLVEKWGDTPFAVDCMNSKGGNSGLGWGWSFVYKRQAAKKCRFSKEKFGEEDAFELCMRKTYPGGYLERPDSANQALKLNFLGGMTSPHVYMVAWGTKSNVVDFSQLDKLTGRGTTRFLAQYSKAQKQLGLPADKLK